MRAVAMFPSERAIRLVDHPDPALERPDDVMLEIIEVGICGTDREIARFDYGKPPEGAGYLVMGHESLGRVVEVGSAVSRLKPGDLVVPTVRRPCPHPSCRACASGRQDFCFTGDFTERGIGGRHGYMTERVVDDQRYMHALPISLAEVGILVEPLTIAEKALIQVASLQSRFPWTTFGPGETDSQRAVVLGAGPVGLLGCMALLARGLETWVYSREAADSHKARWVESVGARYLASGDVPIAQLAEAMGSIDLVYEATGAARLSFEALEELGPNGVFVFTGVPGRKGPIEVDAELIMRRLVLQNQLVFGTVNAGPAAFEAAIADLQTFHTRWPAALAALITGRFGPEAYPELLIGPRSGIKPVMRFSGEA